MITDPCLLAIDLAFRNVGLVLLVKGIPIIWGTAKTKAVKRKQDRISDVFASECADLSDRLHKIINKYPVKGITAELPNGSQNAIAAKLLGGAVGILAAVASCNNIPVEWISEGDSKTAAFNRRKVTKEESMQWARNKYPVCNFPKAASTFEHIADALLAYNGLRNGLLIRTFG
jgi:Holliday junction resolvasome RuvABC endonuclease subunit